MILRVLLGFTLLGLFIVSEIQAQEIQSPMGIVKISKKENGAWQLLVNGKPYFIKGFVFYPVKIGESATEGTIHDWMYINENHDGRNDEAFKTWIDKNHNNHKDADEPEVGDFQIMKDLGVNTIRFYNVPSDNPLLGDIYKTNPATALQFDHPVNKSLLRILYSNYGIRVIMENYVGAWTIGSGAPWDRGTDYTNPKDIENIKKSVKAMVLDNKDEPYVLMWELGNENNTADWSNCNAKQQPEAYVKLLGELAHMIHQIDPNHPVAVSLGDAGMDNQKWLQLLAKYAPEVDIIAYNAYRGMFGFGSMWKEAKRDFDRPVFMAEFGTPAYNIKKGEDQKWQNIYIRGCWKDIVQNSSEYYDPTAPEKGAGNSIGGTIYDWLDRWYMNGNPWKHDPGTEPSGSSVDGIDHEEWFGVMSMGDGSDWLMRNPRKICAYLKDKWNQEKLSF